MKTKILYAFVVALVVLLAFSCKDEKVPTQSIDPNILKVLGDYKATKFQIPEKTDGKFDVLGAGGFLELTLKINNEVNGKIYIPASNLLGPNSGINQSISGDYFFRNDSLNFNNLGNFLDNPQLIFIYKSNSFEAKMVGIAPTVILLEKNEK